MRFVTNVRWRDLFSRPCLTQTKACACLLTLVALLAFSSVIPAHAGTWQIVYTLQGNGQYYTGPADNPYAWVESALPSDPVITNGDNQVWNTTEFTYGTQSQSVSATFQATLYWIPAGSNDSAPANVTVQECPSADWCVSGYYEPHDDVMFATGTADDGRGDPAPSFYDGPDDSGDIGGEWSGESSSQPLQNLTVEQTQGTVPGTSLPYTAVARVPACKLSASAQGDADDTYAYEAVTYPYFRPFETLVASAEVGYYVSLASPIT